MQYQEADTLTETIHNSHYTLSKINHYSYYKSRSLQQQVNHQPHYTLQIRVITLQQVELLKHDHHTYYH